ncbi:MAG TPA: DUF1499 domain-containing protein [Stellaceae bacterium]|nr:DUF1499 domain-containing protein [Stellaceae bacterium]
MRVVRRILNALVALVLGLATFGLALRIYLGREAENRLAPSEAIGITELHSPLPKPGFLACPPGYCPAAEAIASPVFALPWERLHAYWTEVISGETRVEPILADPDSRRFVYIQHSPTFRFPDVITVEFVQLGPDRSSIALYSRSRYGEYDFGKNRKRVVRWLALLEKVAQPAIQHRGRAQ